MLSINEVAEKSKLLTAIALAKKWPSIESEKRELKTGYHVIRNAAEYISITNLFINVVEDDYNIVFYLPRFSAYPLVIKNEDRDREDPPVFINKNGDTIPLLNHSSIILLTEFAFALFQNSDHAYMHNDLKNYPIMRNYFTLLCKEVEFPNKIWVSKTNDCFNLVLANEEKQYFVCSNAEVLTRLKTELQLVPNTSIEKKSQPFESSFILGGTLTEGVLSGRVQLPGVKNVIDATLEDEDSLNPNLDLLILRAKNFAMKLTDIKIKELAKMAAVEVTNAAYSQFNRSVEEEDCKPLADDMELKEVNFFGNEVVLVFTSNNEFPNKKIFVQLNKSVQIVDVTVS